MEKHKVLVFGDETFGNTYPTIKSELFEVTFQRFPPTWEKHRRASDYSIVILDYSAFPVGCEEEQNIFEKELFEALDKGATICFLHYDEEVPRYDEHNYQEGKMNSSDIEKLLNKQIGFRFLYYLHVRPTKIPRPIHWGETKRSEFKSYLDKWGSSKNVFECYGKGIFDDRIQSLRDVTLGFCSKLRKGLLIYLPCQRDFSNLEQTSALFSVLIDSLITYGTRIRTELPEFAKQPFFQEEKAIYEKLQGMETEMKKLQEKFEPYNSAKALAFASDYRFEKLMPQFLTDELGLLTERIETYNEDFWLLDSSRNKLAICETKTYVKGFKKGGVFRICDHREHYKLEESFPAILFVNLNLNAPGWKQKLSPIAPQDYQVATSNNILIITTEDLLFMWDALKQKKLTTEGILKLLTTNKGWLCFKPDHTYEMKQ